MSKSGNAHAGPSPQGRVPASLLGGGRLERLDRLEWAEAAVPNLVSERSSGSSARAWASSLSWQPAAFKMFPKQMCASTVSDPKNSVTRPCWSSFNEEGLIREQSKE